MRRTIVRFGVFATVTIGLTLWIGGQIIGFNTSSRYRLSATFDDVSGLSAGDDVKLAGVKVGKVATITPVSGRALVSFDVYRSVPLPSDSEADVRWRNLIGQRYIEVKPGRSTRMLSDGASLHATRSVVDIGDLLNRLGPLVGSIDPQQLNTLVQGMTQVLDGNTNGIHQMVSEFGDLLTVLGRRDGTIRQLITDANTVSTTLADRDREIQTIVDNLVLLSQTFAANTDLLDRGLEQFAGASQGMKRVVADNAGQLDTMLTSLAAVTGTAASRVGDLEQTLANLPAAMHQLYSTTDRGELLTIFVSCVAPSPKCPYPMMEGSSLENGDDRRLGNDGYGSYGTAPSGGGAAPSAAGGPSGPSAAGRPQPPGGLQALAALFHQELS